MKFLAPSQPREVARGEKQPDVPGTTAEYFVKLQRPSHNPPSFDEPDLETRMAQARAELARIRAKPEDTDSSD